MPVSAGKAFKDAGHEVTYLRERIATDSPDPLVAAVAEANEAILVSLDADFKKIAKRHGVGKREFRNLSLVKLSCRESRVFIRLVDAMSLIEHEWNFAQGNRDRRLFVDIMDAVIRTYR